jgi:hypothetical protein
VLITGANLLGSVTFNGLTANYIVVGANDMLAIVPTGALTGSIAVTTPMER